jgi:hypothetical protein
VVADLFKDFEEWTIACFDNLLVLAHDYEDAYHKLEKIIDRCIARNVYLKLSKSWLGVEEVTFFGYVVRHNSFGLSEERQHAIANIPFPTNKKSMQRFLGSALYFKPFIPNYSALTSQLTDMLSNKFSWKKEEWTVDYERYFVNLIEEILKAKRLFYPNYDLDSPCRCFREWSGVGAVLFQSYLSEEGNVLQPVVCVSHKFSTPATRWSVIEQEMFAIYFAFLQLQFYLRCKFVVLETDHRNLVYMEQSLVPKIIRWRLFIQGFTFLVRHISGPRNDFADCLSRLFEGDEVCRHVSRDFPEGRIAIDTSICSPKRALQVALKS